MHIFKVLQRKSSRFFAIAGAVQKVTFFYIPNLFRALWLSS